MAVDARTRHDLHQRLAEALGPEGAAALMDQLPHHDPGTLATKDDLDERFTTFGARLDARFESIEARFAVSDARFESIDARFRAIDDRFEQVDARFEQVDARFDALDERLRAMADRWEQRWAEGDQRWRLQLEAMESRITTTVMATLNTHLRVLLTTLVSMFVAVVALVALV